MDVVNAVLILTPLVVLMAGMIAPRSVLWWTSLPSRPFVVVLVLGLFFLDMGIGMWLTPMPGQDTSTPTACLVLGALFLSFSAVQAKIWRRNQGVHGRQGD